MKTRWAPIDARQDLPSLYMDANRPHALSWQTIRFWQAFFDAWKDHSGKAIVIMGQTPHDYNQSSEDRLLIGGYSVVEKRRHFIAIVEAKAASSMASTYEVAERQLYETCRIHLDQAGAETKMVYGVSVVGTRCRMFRYRKGFSWEPLWIKTSIEPGIRSEYIDAADRETGGLIWDALQMILELPPEVLAEREYLMPHFPLRDGELIEEQRLSKSDDCTAVLCNKRRTVLPAYSEIEQGAVGREAWVPLDNRDQWLFVEG